MAVWKASTLLELDKEYFQKLYGYETIQDMYRYYKDILLSLLML